MTTNSKVDRRVARISVHIDSDTHDHLARIGRKTSMSLGALVKFLVDAEIQAYKTCRILLPVVPTRVSRRGAKK